MHSWFKYCSDAEKFENVRTLSQYIKALHAQSNTPDALIPYREDLQHINPDSVDLEETGEKIILPSENYQEDEETKKKNKYRIRAPKYFGAGVEALAEVYFNEFGMTRHNLTHYISQDKTEEDKEDTGYDAMAVTVRNAKKGTTMQKITKSGSSVYIQVKGKLNPKAEHYSNDDSRIMNFYANAQGHARLKGEAYSARYILFTTGKGIHWKLQKNTFDDIEVISYQTINRMTKNNIAFWNKVRKNIGLSMLPVRGPKDPDYLTQEALLAEMEAEDDEFDI